MDQSDLEMMQNQIVMNVPVYLDTFINAINSAEKPIELDPFSSINDLCNAQNWQLVKSQSFDKGRRRGLTIHYFNYTPLDGRIRCEFRAVQSNPFELFEFLVRNDNPLPKMKLVIKGKDGTEEVIETEIED